MRSLRVLPLAAAAALGLPPALAAQGPNPLNLWTVDLRWSGDRLVVGPPRKLTHDDGSNSQPAFTPDGRAIVFSALRDTGTAARSDIYRIDLATGAERRVTSTPENENSPTVLPSGEYVAVRWQPATLFREFGPWVYAPDGTPRRAVLRAPDTTGYYVPLPNGDYALTRPKSRTFTLGIFDARTGAITDVDSGVPALPAQRIPGERALSYVHVDSAGAHHEIRRYDLATHRVTTLAPTLVGRTAHAWIPEHRTVLMAKGNVLYARRIGRDTSWTPVATFTDPELRHLSAYVVSPRGDRLILTSPKRLSLAVVLRDSLESGRPASDVAAMLAAWRDAGRLADYDVAEGALGGLADERLSRAQPAGAVALQTVVASLFPSSYRALARLGDVQRAAGDSSAALASYRRALEVNPRATRADSAAADAVQRKLGGHP
ncbi:Tetratricopeptide TPR_1 repeat-containing protein [Gemmatirosa kalamazoonensis]|uniref:Tetratricopeptide TPR_1 repeat-containing protein n=1 Tax=Gemmatirosa kalamazoonensis TaxID=861299 RepID=W0RQK9_9BACT|nr:PD40 domain-containing protein [Gemmatirosa kalamazoonensis]AHG91828.1 Tetratricopeptide TPR_1 repeat-containing protein [Gemmatirosa kalamazoonensis]